MSYENPRRLEIPIKILGEDHVVVARENIDGEAICYVYCYQQEGGTDDEPDVSLTDNMTEHIFGKLDIMDEKLRTHVLEIAWHAAQRDAHKQAEFLQM
jgi:hypothetical protein